MSGASVQGTQYGLYVEVGCAESYTTCFDESRSNVSRIADGRQMPIGIV